MNPRILLILAIVPTGCNNRTMPSIPPRSPFSTNCNLEAIVLKSVPGPDREAMWGTRGVHRRSSGSPGRSESHNDFHGSFYYQDKEGRKVESRPEDVDRFMRSIKAGISDAARANGARLLGFRDDVREALIRGFRSQYEAGKARGTIEAKIDPEPTSAGLTEVRVEIHEIVELTEVRVEIHEIVERSGTEGR